MRVSKSALVRLLWIRKRNCAQCDMFTPPTSKSCVVVGSCNFRERRIVIWLEQHFQLRQGVVQQRKLQNLRNEAEDAF